MKSKFLLSIFSLSIFFSCSKVMDLTPIDYYTPISFWTQEATVNGYMNGLHRGLRDYQFQFLRLGEFRDGQLQSALDGVFNVSLSELPLLRQEMSETNVPVGSWGGFYRPILEINLFIEQVEKVTFLTPAKKNKFLGQAYGLRAFYYFHLLRTFGGVPLRLTPDVIYDGTQAGLSLPRSTEEEVLTQIKKDVERSITFFVDNSEAVSNKGLWSINASQMLKGDVYLWSAKVYNTTTDFTIAKAALDSVKGTELNPAFAAIFNHGSKKSSEIIFAIDFTYGEASLPVTNFLYDNVGSMNGLYYSPTLTGPTFSNATALNLQNSTGLLRYYYDISLYNKFEIGDKRRDATLFAMYRSSTNDIPGGNIIASVTVLKKFLGYLDGANRRYADDWPVYREADRLLLLAEIANAENDAATLNTNLKKIRERAGLIHTNIATGDAAEIAIFEERLKEFVWEGKGWYDLRRMKVGGKPMAFKSTSHNYGVLDETTESHKLLWPIEKGIWTTDPLVNQTPGYATSKP